MTGTVEQELRRTARETFGWEELRPEQLAAASRRSTRCRRCCCPARPSSSARCSPCSTTRSRRCWSGPTRWAAPSVNSTQTTRQHEQALADHAADGLEFLFLSPEQLARDDTLDLLRASPPSLSVVDEAHCVSAWGHDFRPDHLRVGSVVEALGHPPVAVLTATASPPVREEIIARLGLRDPLVVMGGFDRPTIHLDVVEALGDDADKRRTVVEQVAAAAKPALV